MSMGVGKTAYSLLGGGAKGYINIGGWNTTLTDVCNTAKETIGMVRKEGANTYMYVQLGTATAGSAGAFLYGSTGYADTNGITAPFAMSAGGVAATGITARGMTVVTVNDSGPIYAWMLIEGLATGYMMTDSGVAWNDMVCPSTSTANLLDGEAAAATAVGKVLGPAVTTAVASAGGAGVLVYWHFKSLGGVY